MARTPSNHGGGTGDVGNGQVGHRGAQWHIVNDHIIHIVAAAGGVGYAEGNISACALIVGETYKLLRIRVVGHR